MLKGQTSKVQIKPLSKCQVRPGPRQLHQLEGLRSCPWYERKAQIMTFTPPHPYWGIGVLALRPSNMLSHGRAATTTTQKGRKRLSTPRETKKHEWFSLWLWRQSRRKAPSVRGRTSEHLRALDGRHEELGLFNLASREEMPLRQMSSRRMLLLP